MSENTETFVIVVSEETGQISVMRNGNVNHNISAQELRKEINIYLHEPKEAKKEADAVNADASELREEVA